MIVRVNGLVVQTQGGFLSDGDIHALGLSNVRVGGRGIAVVGQPTTGHGSFPPTVSILGSPTVRAMNLGIVRFGDPYAPHTDGTTVHVGTAAPI